MNTSIFGTPDVIVVGAGNAAACAALAARESGANVIPLKPLNKRTVPLGYLVIDFERNFDRTNFALVLKPIPKLRDTIERVVVSIGVDKNVCVDEEKHSLYSPATGWAASIPSNGPTLVGFTARTRATLDVDNRPDESSLLDVVRSPSPSRCLFTT